MDISSGGPNVHTTTANLPESPPRTVKRKGSYRKQYDRRRHNFRIQLSTKVMDERPINNTAQVAGYDKLLRSRRRRKPVRRPLSFAEHYYGVDLDAPDEDITGSINTSPRTSDTQHHAVGTASKRTNSKAMTPLTKGRQSRKDAERSAISVAGDVDEARYQSTGLQYYTPEPMSTRRAVLEIQDETSARWRAAGTCSNSMAVIVQRLQELKRGHPNRMTGAVDEDTGAILLIL